MSRPVEFNTITKFEGIPEGYMGEGFMATNFETGVPEKFNMAFAICYLLLWY